ncbi:MAG: MOSC domain-containing protein [Planctomycetota bacterium]|jgi:MOSC domain-containing protein YiiM
MGRVESINISEGGVPKFPVGEAAISKEGLDGDRQRNTEHHGGPDKAVSLYSTERIEALKEEGHPIAPGTTGENLTVSGIEWDRLAPGGKVEVGELLLEITGFATPCADIAGSFEGGAFDRISEKNHPGWSRLYAKVLRGGKVRPGDAVVSRPRE